MDCCGAADEIEPQAITDCPRCGTRGRSVTEVTLDALLKAGTERADGPHRFCRNPVCEVVYFAESTGAVLGRGALTVRVGQKEDAPDRPVCYCFGYSAADIGTDVATTGTSPIPEIITEHCRRGEDRCPETNPQGSCCLGNVGTVLREAQVASSATTDRACVGEVS